MSRAYSSPPVMRRARSPSSRSSPSLAAVVQVSSADAQASQPQIAASSWYLVGDDGAVLARSDADRARAIASITKLMTAVVVLENAELTDVVRVSPRSCGHRRVDGLPPCRRGAHGRGAAARDADPERERRGRSARATCRARICRSIRRADERESRRARSLGHALREPARPRRGRARIERARYDRARPLRARHPVHPRCALALDRVAPGREDVPDHRRPARVVVAARRREDRSHTRCRLVAGGSG